jgi:hypothetical protein
MSSGCGASESENASGALRLAMSKAPVVERRYEPDKVLCALAVESLLKKEVVVPRQAGNLEDEKGSMHDSRRAQYTRT